MIDPVYPDAKSLEDYRPVIGEALDELRALDCSQVALETSTPSSPGVLRPVGVENYVHVVMPMFVQW